MGSSRLLMLFVGLAWFTGCDAPAKFSNQEANYGSVPYSSSDELEVALAGEPRLVLVEFCVPVGCFRCDEMRPQIDALANEEQDHTVVHRVNIILERALATRLGVTVCPS